MIMQPLSQTEEVVEIMARWFLDRAEKRSAEASDQGFATTDILLHWRMFEREARDLLQAITRTHWIAPNEPTEAMIAAGCQHENMGDMAGRYRSMRDSYLCHHLREEARRGA